MLKKNNQDNILLKSMLSGMLIALSSCQQNLDTHDRAPSSVNLNDLEKMGKCSGINSCRGQSDCAANGHSCAGKNNCKGQGWLNLNRKDCQEEGGAFIP